LEIVQPIEIYIGHLLKHHERHLKGEDAEMSALLMIEFVVLMIVPELIVLGVGVWTTDLACWTDKDIWNINKNRIVRCTNMEGTNHRFLQF
jgi:hypothetical protein